ncbi:hypothetical protein C8R44DRAFT_848350 [Mycena epipterygia]|nr:hypothetical protein C8R44DRAFT_848350 [Mycena epipterygia]
MKMKAVALGSGAVQRHDAATMTRNSSGLDAARCGGDLDSARLSVGNLGKQSRLICSVATRTGVGCTFHILPNLFFRRRASTLKQPGWTGQVARVAENTRDVVNNHAASPDFGATLPRSPPFRGSTQLWRSPGVNVLGQKGRFVHFSCSSCSARRYTVLVGIGSERAFREFSHLECLSLGRSPWNLDRTRAKEKYLVPLPECIAILTAFENLTHLDTSAAIGLYVGKMEVRDLGRFKAPSGIPNPMCVQYSTQFHSGCSGIGRHHDQKLHVTARKKFVFHGLMQKAVPTSAVSTSCVFITDLSGLPSKTSNIRHSSSGMIDRTTDAVNIWIYTGPLRTTYCPSTGNLLKPNFCLQSKSQQAELTVATCGTVVIPNSGIKKGQPEDPRLKGKILGYDAVDDTGRGVTQYTQSFLKGIYRGGVQKREE